MDKIKVIKKWLIAVTVVACVFVIAFSVVFIRSGYARKVLVKMGLKEEIAVTDWTAVSWNSCLEQLDYDADVVFFGDSITRGGDFQKYFPDSRTVNLGCSGDTLSQMIERVPMVKAVSPEKVFLMGGINGLIYTAYDTSVKRYEELLLELKKQLPDAEIYVQSVLPISSSRETANKDNAIIIKFNDQIKRLAEKYSLTYIDLHSVYEMGGVLKSDYTTDGVHLNEQAYLLWVDKIKQYVE